MKILVVVDMQNDFMSGSLGTKEAQAIVPKVVQKIKEWDGYIYVTQDTHTENYLNTQEGKNLPVKHCLFDTWGHEIEESINNAIYEREEDLRGIFYKNTFGSYELALDLFAAKNREGATIDEIQLVGVCTGICVISNALLIKAFLPEVKISVDASCCACVTPESHKRALETMKLCQIEIINEENNND